MQFTQEERAILEKKFFKDPDWHIVQKAVGDELIKLEGLSGIDTKMPAEDVKCQVMAHQKAQSILTDFFISCGILPPERGVSPEEARFN